MAGHRSWSSVCSAVLALIIISTQGINSQTESNSALHIQEYTTEYIAHETYSQTDLTDAKSRQSRSQESLDDVTFSDEATEVLPDVKVVTKKETKIPDSASRVIIPITNFTVNTLPRVVIKTPPAQTVNSAPIKHVVEPTRAINSAPTKHVVEPLEDKDLEEMKIVPKPVNQNKNEIKAHVQYDEVTGELKTEEHPCKRECKEGEEPMICFYHFNLEHYQTMSKACYSCPYNATDCNRPDCIPADGMNRPITVVNRKMPGPSIEVCEGDRIIVDVENDLMTEATTVHWHGQHQKNTPYMDGTPYVTQCPILPETTFRYQFNANTPGTHFWHSHSGMQRADGAAGSLIIRKPKSQEPHARLYDYDRSDHTMIVTDWIHDLSLGMFTHHHHSWGDNKPPTLLINGVGRFAVFDNATHTAKPVYMKSAVFNVEQGYRYRFRVINAEFLNCPIEMSVDGHNITVIASDGFDLEPITATSLVTYAGERFDFIIDADNEIDNYWIRFRGLMDCDERFTKAKQVAVLRYEGAMEAEPAGDPTWEELHNEGLQLNALNRGEEDDETVSVSEMQSIAGYDDSLKEHADYQFYVSYDFYPKNNSHFHRSPYYGYYQVPEKANRLYTPQLNHISMKMPSSPLLVSRPSADNFCNSSSIDKSCKEEYCECSHVLSVKLNSVVEIVLVDEGVTFDANHPFHLHGHNFRVVGMRRLGNQTTIEEVKAFDAAGYLTRNLRNAPLKDTITVPDGGYTVIRFKADNPGYWLFHCHIEFHVEVGMALVFKVGEHKDMRPVPRNFPSCGSYMPDNNLEFDTTVSPPNDNNVIQISHWWPVVFVNNTSSAVTHSCYFSVLSLCCIWLLKFAIGT